MANQRRLPWDLQVKFQDETKLVLSEWSFLRDLIRGFWDRKYQQFKSNILVFFTETADPDMNKIATMLNDATFKTLNSFFWLLSPSEYKARGPWLKENLDTGRGYSIEPCTKPVEDLWNLYQSCLVEEVEDDENKKLKLSMDKFELGVQHFLSEWSALNNNVPLYIELKIGLIKEDIYIFFSRTAEPDADAVVLMLCQVIDTNLEISVDLSTCNQVAERLLKMYQSLLDGNY